MAKVSIVIPTRNRAQLLKSAITSALRQTYQDVEILVSDNYCIDDTKSVVDSFKDPRIRYVRSDEPLDMPKSWNFAFSHATGEYITYLTDDSYLLPDSIETALSKIEQFNVKIAGAGGGGFLIIVSEPNKHDQIASSMNKLGLRKYRFGFDSNGTVVSEIS